MTMDKSAVEHIQQTAHIPEMLESIRGQTDNPCSIVPDNYRIFDLEKYNNHRSSYRMKLETNVIADFVAYCHSNHEDGAACAIDVDGMSAKTIFDVGSKEMPGHKRHTASLELKMTSAFRALEDISKCAVSQREIAEFIEDWADFITATSADGKHMEAQDAAKGLRNVKIDERLERSSEVGDFSESGSVMEQIEAAHQDTLPGRIHFTCEPYLGLAERTIDLRVSLISESRKSGTPSVRVRIVQAEKLKEDMANEFRDILLGSNMKAAVYLGTLSE